MLTKITKIIREYKGDESIELTEQTSFEALELDSLETVELVMNMEDALGVKIEMNTQIKTVGDLIKIIESN